MAPDILSGGVHSKMEVERDGICYTRSCFSDRDLFSNNSFGQEMRDAFILLKRKF